ncbi:S-adenosyl-L-methionine-dependent methyltransferase [Russula earlei]|uniref:S-adenosyl-L-methionine-dependent methyltransferase n=1 Tax=Russula earlei TaxID=71964 RepID=A0ACC0TTW4_9AGAM|nr:S-adenosyl-L-methionine-dependent methyltransferase [Russula earlei]
MTFPLPSVLDRADNPYMPRHLQNLSLNLDIEDFAVQDPLPEFLPSNIGQPEINGAHRTAISTAGPVHDDVEAHTDDSDDNSSESLDPVEDDEFPFFFAQRGSPPRLFHSHGTYRLPVDSDEMKRQEAQHILLRKILGSNYPASIHEILNDIHHERKVVDLCTGAGHWVLEMAKEFPDVEFRGLDLVPIQTRYPPRNVRFEIADVTERLRFADGSVDLVHARMTCLRAEAVPRFLREVMRILRPGGVFLSVEWGVQPSLHPEHPYFAEHDVYIPKTVSFYSAASGIVPTLAPQILHLIGQTASFEELVSRHWAIPISTPYSPDVAPSHSLDFVSWVMGRITQGYADALVAGGFPQEDADAFKAELDGRFGIYNILQTVCARKRLSDGVGRGAMMETRCN